MSSIPETFIAIYTWWLTPILTLTYFLWFNEVYSTFTNTVTWVPRKYPNSAYSKLSSYWVPSNVSSEKTMATHSSTLAWKIPCMKEPGSLQSMGSWKVRHDWVTSLSLFTFMHWRRKWQPIPVFFPEESQKQGSLWAAVHEVAQSRTRLKRLSSSSSSKCLLQWFPFTPSF